MPETPSSSSSLLASYRLGIGLSFALSLWVTGFGLVAIFDTRLTGQEWLLLALLAFFGAGGLALALLITLFVYFVSMRKNAPTGALLLMIIPPLLAVGLIPFYLSMARTSANQVPDTHPSVWEAHVNLSDQSLWLARDVKGIDIMGAPPRMPIAPAQAISFSRYPDEGVQAIAKFPYEAAHLRSNVQAYAYGRSDEPGKTAMAQRTLPLVRRPYPDLQSLTPYEREDGLLLHQYFHYRDHVEMVPSLPAPSESFESEMQGKASDLVRFYLSNRVAPVIARLEVNGQTLVLVQDRKIETTDCSRGNTPVGYALLDLNAPLRLRWQTLDDPAHWHEASVRVPAWKQALPGKPASLPSVTLYFTRGGRVAVERFQLLSETPPYKSGLIATGMPAGIAAGEACGSATDYYPDYLKRFQ